MFSNFSVIVIQLQENVNSVKIENKLTFNNIHRNVLGYFMGNFHINNTSILYKLISNNYSQYIKLYHNNLKKWIKASAK